MRTLLIVFTLTAALFAQTGSTPATKSMTAKSKSATTKSKAAAKTPAKAAAKPAATADHPIAVFDTSMGKIACELFPDKAPKTVANFIGLARGTKDWKHPYTGQDMKGTPLYDNTTFHRVIPNFMIQGGDPVGNGTGDPGYRFEDELVPDLKFDHAGRLAMANSGPNTDGSQFFITESPNPHLDACFDEQGCMRGGRLVPKGYGYTIFGQCDEPSVAVVTKIARVATDPRNNKPFEPVTVKHIEIVGAEEPAKPAAAPAKSKSKAKAKSATKAKSKSNPAAQQPK